MVWWKSREGRNCGKGIFRRDVERGGRNWEGKRIKEVGGEADGVMVVVRAVIKRRKKVWEGDF